MNLVRKAMLAAAVLFGANAAKADILIDDFSAPGAGIIYSINGTDPNPTVINTNGVVAGVNRSITLSVSSTPVLSNSLSGDIGGAAGIFTMAFNGSSSGSGVINYSFTSPINLVPTGVLGSLQYLSAADAGFGANVPLNFVITTASGNLTFNTFMNLTSGFTPTNVPLASFTGTGDLTQATGMSITILGGQAADVALDAIAITTPQPPPPETVPAPPAALLALLALPALGLRNRWKREESAMA